MKKLLLMLWVGVSIAQAQNNHVTVIQYQDGQYDILDAATICPGGVKVIASGMGIPTEIGGIRDGRLVFEDSQGKSTSFTKEHLVEAINHPGVIQDKAGWDEWFCPQLKSFTTPWVFEDRTVKHQMLYISRLNIIAIDEKEVLQKDYINYFWISIFVGLGVLIALLMSSTNQGERKQSDVAHRNSSIKWILFRHWSTANAIGRLLLCLILWAIIVCFSYLFYSNWRLFIYPIITMEVSLLIIRYWRVKFSKNGYRWQDGSSELEYTKSHQEELNPPSKIPETETEPVIKRIGGGGYDG